MRVPFSLRHALREGRSGIKRVGWFMSAIALGIAVLIGLYGFQKDAASGARSEARDLLGGDIRLQGNNAFDERVESILDSLAAEGTRVARGTSLASIVSVPGTGVSRLLQVNAVDASFPAAGRPEGVPADVPVRLGQGGGIAVDPQVMVQLGVAVGDVLRIGNAEFEVLGTLSGVPVDFGLQWIVGPPVFVSAADLEETGILGFGSLAQHRAWIALPAGEEVDGLVRRHRGELRARGVSVQTAEEEAEAMAIGFEGLSRFLSLVGLMALVLGGIGVGSAVSVYLRDKRTPMAVLRCLGAPQGTLFRAYLMQTVLLGGMGAALGVLGGLGIQFGLPGLLGSVLPFALSPSLHWEAIGAGLVLGTWVAVVFSLLPLLRAPGVSPLVALRALGDDEVPAPLVLQGGVALLILLTLFGLATLQLGDARVGLAITAALVVGVVGLGLLGRGLIGGLRAFLPRGAPFSVRQGLSGLFRPGNQTVTVVTALGLGAFLMGALLVVESGLRAGLALELGPDRPSLVLFDIQPDQRDRVADILAAEGLESEDIPLVPARIASVGTTPVSDLLARTRSRNAWIYRRVYRNTYRLERGEEERVIAGQWWTEEGGEDERVASARAEGLHRISLEVDLAQDLGVGIGDRIGWDVQGVTVNTVIASLREVEWASFQPNFFAVFEPGALEGAPGTSVALVRSADAAARNRVQTAVLRDLPNVSFLDVTTVQETLTRIAGQIALVLRSMAAFVLAGGGIVLLASLLTTRFQRRRESALLKTLGARAGTIRGALLSEYAALGGVGGLAGVLLGGVGGHLLLRYFFDAPGPLPWMMLAGLWMGVLILSVLVGWSVSGPVLRSPPMAVLREES